MFDQFNQFLFFLFNAAPGLSGWRLQLALFAAEWVVLSVPAGLVLMWINGAPGQCEAAVRALLAALVALTISKLIGLTWFHPRPFMLGLGQALGLAVAWARVFLGVHWPLDMIAAFMVSALAALLVNTDTGGAFAATLVGWMEGVYRRVLAAPIARGWLRP